jgi:chitodextrinase
VHSPELYPFKLVRIIQRQSLRASWLRPYSVGVVIALGLGFSGTAVLGQTLNVTADIGAVGAAGSSSYVSGTGTYTLRGAGPDIAGTADAFRFTYKTVSGNSQIIAKVASVQNTNAAAKGGVMIRESTAAGARHAMLVVTPSSGVQFSYRTSTGGSTITVTLASRIAPQWVKLIRTNTTSFAAYVSRDGTRWEFIGTATVSMAASSLVGVCDTSKVSATLCTCTFDNVTVTAGTITDATAPAAPTGLAVTSKSDVTVLLSWIAAIDDVGVSSYDIYRNGVKVGSSAGTDQTFVDSGLAGSATYSYTIKALDVSGKVSVASAALPVTTNANFLGSPWQHQDIGPVGVAGTATSTSGITIQGAGVDFGGTADSGHIVYQTLSGNCEVIARVASIQNTDSAAKAGVIIRETVNPGAPFALMCVTPGTGASFIRRTTTGGAATTTSGGATVAAPYWMRLVRSGSTFYSYKSSDGANWSFVASASITMTTNVLVGFATTSKNNSVICSAVFDNFTTSIDSDADGLPDRWEQQYFGNLTQSGTSDFDGDGLSNSQELANGTNPTDYYNGIVPTVTIVSGNNQIGTPGTFFSSPLIAKVMNGATPMNNAPVTFAVTQGGGQLSATSGGAVSSTLVVRTASTGQAAAYFRAPSTEDAANVITATAISGGGSPNVTFNAASDSLPRTGLKMWLRGDRGITKDAANRISTWADQSGNGKNATQTVSANRPLAVDNLFNGRAGVSLGANLSFFNLPNFLTPFSQATIVIVHRVGFDLGGPKGFWLMGGGFDSATYGSGNMSRDDFGSTIDHFEYGPVQSFKDAHVYSVVSRPNEWTSRFNGKVWFTTSLNTVAFPTTPRIGKNGSSCFKGDIAEVLFYDHALSQAELDAVHGYLNFKYAYASSALSVPLSLAATPLTPRSVSLNWQGREEPASTSYLIERKIGAGGTYAQIGIVRDIASFTDSALTANTSYTYRVRATRFGQISAYSAETTVTTTTTDPIPVAGLVEWLRSDLGITQNGQNAVAAWTDLSGNNNTAFQPVGGMRPRFVPNLDSGGPAIRFGATSEYGRSFLNLPDFLTSATAAEVFVVLKTVPVSMFGMTGLWNLGLNNNNSTYSENGIVDSFGSANAGYTGKPSQPLDSRSVYNVVSKSGEWTNRLNGVQLSTTASNTVGFSILNDFGSTLGFEIGDGFDGHFFELLIYNRALTSTERQQVQSYLNQKYNLVVTTLQTPTNFKVTAVSPTQGSLIWQSTAPPSTSFKIERRTAGGSYVVIATVSGTTSYLDTGLAAGNQYYYRISATNMAATSSPTSEVGLTTLSIGADFPLGNLKCWLKADAGVLVGPDNLVGTWLDQSGNDSNASQYSGFYDGDPLLPVRPKLTPSGVFGRPCINFDGKRNSLNLVPLVDDPELFTEGEVFVVLQAAEDLPATQKGLWTLGPNAFSNYPYAGGEVTDNFGTSYANWFTPLQRLSYYNVYNVVSSPSEWTSRLNGSINFTRPDNTPQFNTSGLSSLGVSGNPASYFAGNIAEILIYNRALSQAERDTVERYLENKYGVSDSDGDGLPDWWEVEHFGNLNQNGSGDFDQDGVPNLDEFVNGLRPELTDTDGDGMTDGFEINHGLNPLLNDASSDLDGDGVINSEDADPQNPNIGRLNIFIIAPENDSTVP